MVERTSLLQDLLKNIAVEQRYDKPTIEIKSISNDSRNYTSALFEIKILSAERQELNLFGKMIILNQLLAKYTLFFQRECHVYIEILRNFERIQDKNNIRGYDRLIFPKLYGYNGKFKENVIIFDDLKTSGFLQLDRQKAVDWNYASKAIEELAKFHALSFAFGLENPEEYRRMLEEVPYLVAEDEQSKDLVTNMFASAVNVAKTEYKEKLMMIGARLGSVESVALEFYSPLRRPVIAHGDYRVSNLMHKVCHDGNLQFSIIDWQISHAGSAVSDLIYFIFSGTDQAFRRRYYERLVDFYYGQLRQALMRMKVDIDDVYPREDFDYELKKMLPLGLLVSVCILPLVLVDTADAPDIAAENFNWEKIAVKPSQQYADRLNGILEDYAQWGLL